ncbi:unnamed protein product [Oncorhynchus mykiss]|uniref:Uncharacterized protein n=1 Tax=Oncorhynchus mykiss TaxID=8022 RepID=A0A060YKM5_ONCMY|nr:unnamed protein product [Oncorhynchus mykiss]
MSVFILVFTVEVRSLHTVEVRSLHTVEVRSLHTVEVRSLHTVEVRSLHTVEVRSLHTVEVRSLHTVEVRSLHTVEVRSLHTVEVRSLHTVEVRSLHTVEVGCLHTVEVGCLHTLLLESLKLVFPTIVYRQIIFTYNSLDRNSSGSLYRNSSGSEVCTHCSRDFGPLLHTDLLQILQVSGLSLGNTDFQLPPKMFYWVQVWRLARPLQDLELLLTEPLLSCPGCVFWVVVMLEDPATTHLQCSF